jgi:hypothetical protein
MVYEVIKFRGVQYNARVRIRHHKPVFTEYSEAGCGLEKKS